MRLLAGVALYRLKVIPLACTHGHSIAGEGLHQCHRQKPNNPDSSTLLFIEQVLSIATEFAHVFSESDVSKCFYLFDDFHSCGRISGHRRIPLVKLQSGKKYIIEGQRLEVNPSVDRYKREMANLSAAL